MIYSFAEYDKDNRVKPESLKVLIDGGTESFAGQSRLVIPGSTPCFECNIDTIAESKVYNFCTITHTPRIPEHCIAYAFLIEWDKTFPSRNYVRCCSEGYRLGRRHHLDLRDCTQAS